MSIREYLGRRFLRVTLLVLVLDVVTFLLASFAPEQNAIGSALAFAVVLSIPAYIIIMVRTRCPRCKRRVGMMAWWIGMERESAFLSTGRCPHCGVGVNEPMDARIAD